MGLDTLLEAKETRQHELGAVADSVDSRVLNNDSLVGGKEGLERLDDLAESGLVATVVVLPLSVEDIVKGDHGAVVLGHDTGADTTELLHVGTNTEEETKVDAEGSDIGTGLAGNPEDTEMTVIVELDELRLVNGTDTKLALDGRDQRRSLEESTGEGLEGGSEGSLTAGDAVVEADNANVLLTSTLLGLDKSGGTVDADNQAAGDLGIEGTGVTSLLNTVEGFQSA